ncbi:MAG: MBL fold metallo-hydrolase [Segniliparus sp.]|uniref:MBL fold metallo-hydrolase n=1 Tax=Segniliparus sp. TaxID=2804064 RepID=UPI003F2EA510
MTTYARAARLAGGLSSFGLAAAATAHARDVLLAIGPWPEPGKVFENLPEPSVSQASSAPGDSEARLSLWEAANLLVRQLRPSGPGLAIPTVRPLFPVEPGDLAATWFGHASVLVEVDGRRVLTDPVWSRRCSPSQLVGPARLHPPPLPLEHVPELDVVLLSHDHYDHLDVATIRVLAERTEAVFVTPLGVGAHLRHWGVPADRIVERGWWEEAVVGDLVLTCAPARHFSGRGLRRNTSLWASWSIAGPRHKVYFGGDSGHTRSFAEIGERLGRHDLTLLPIGAYNDLWREIHMNPEEAVQAHLALAKPAAPMLPIHWATFRLAPHPWAEPVERLQEAQRAHAGLRVLYPEPGRRVDATRPHANTVRWWESATR